MTIKWIGSPNFDSNRTKIDTIFIHWIVGTLSSADAQFQKAAGTSAHYGIEDDIVHQYVKEENVAYHAGVYSQNQRSIGIEHSADPNRPASDKTYETSARLIAEISKRHSIPLDRTHVRGHKEVRSTQCPGTMDIDRLITLARQGVKNSVAVDSGEFEQLVGKATERDKFVAAGFMTVEDVMERLDEKEKIIQNLTKDLKFAEEKITEVMGENTELQRKRQEESEKDKEFITELHALQKTVQPLKDELQAIRKELGIFDESSIIEAIKALKASRVKQAKKPETFLEKLMFLLS